MKHIAECGRTMLEMLAVIAVISIITAGAASAIRYQLILFRSTGVQTEIQDIVRGVTDLYAWDRDFTNLNMQTICENDILSKPCQGSNEDMYWENAFGGTIKVTPTELYIHSDEQKNQTNETAEYRPDRIVAESQKSFAITYTNVPEQACRQFVCYTNWTNVRIKSHTNSSDDDCNVTCPAGSTMTFVPKTF